MERYSKPLSSHVKLVQEHTQFLVNRLASYSKRYASAQTEPYREELQDKMKAIQEELVCVEDYVKENYPVIVNLLDALKDLPIREEHDEVE